MTTATTIISTTFDQRYKKKIKLGTIVVGMFDKDSGNPMVLMEEAAEMLDKLIVIEDKVDKLTEMLASLLRDKTNAAAAPTGDTASLPCQMEFPRFNSGEYLGWLGRAEQYFGVYEIKEEAKVGMALVAMDGVAFNWVNWVVRRRPKISWKEFKCEVMSLFGEDPTATAFEALICTAHKGSVNQYINAFVSRAVHVEGLSESQIVGLFTRGLREEIRIRIRAEDATDIVNTMRLAREIEHRLGLLAVTQHQQLRR